MPGKHEARNSSHMQVRREQLFQGPRVQRSAKRDRGGRKAQRCQELARNQERKQKSMLINNVCQTLEVGDDEKCRETHQQNKHETTS